MRQGGVEDDLFAGPDDHLAVRARISVVGQRRRLHLIEQWVGRSLAGEFLPKMPPPQRDLVRGQLFRTRGVQVRSSKWSVDAENGR